MEILEDPFVLSRDEYQRDLNVMKDYVEQNALYLCLMEGGSVEEAKQFIISLISPGGEYEFKDPVLHHTVRDPNGDRRVAQSGYMQYINDAIRQNDIIAPTLTRYMHPSVFESPLVKSIDRNVAKRKVNKKAMFVAEAQKKTLLAAQKNKEQTNNKLSNNAVSGGHVSPSTILHNKTAHSALTSTCRITSGYGNANNEKFLCGNRHYRNVETVLNNIVSIVALTDLPRMQAFIDTNGFVYPTVENVMAAIKECTQFYFRDTRADATILELVQKLSPIQRAAFLYTGDLHNIRILNEQYVRMFFDALSHQSTVPHPDPKTVIKQAGDDYIGLANQIHPEIMKGVKLEDIEGTEGYALVAATVENIYNTLQRYKDFIRIFFTSRNMPASLGYFPKSVRRSALISDTDSTIFTVQDWVKWYSGDYLFDQKSMAVAASVVFMASQTITHLLAMMSANLGVEKKRLHQIQMKNEYKFDVITPTLLAKHYYALIGCREGNVYEKHKQEIKGVHLKSSNAPKEIMKAAAAKMRDLCERPMKGIPIRLYDELKELADLERSILKAIQAGDSKYFRRLEIKSKDSYKKGPYQSNYQHYLMWNAVFGPKYGMADEPAYVAVKVNLDVKSDRSFKEMLDEMKDQEVAERFRKYMKEAGKTKMLTLYVPLSRIQAIGMPPEIFEAMKYRKIIYDCVSVFYKIIESLGYHIIDDKQRRLVSEIY